MTKVLPTSSPPARSGRPRVNWRDQRAGYLFVLPALLLIGVFGIFPIGYALYMSLYNWRVRQLGFVGLENYTQLVGNWGGALAFVAGILLILAAHWLWTDAARRFSRLSWLKWGGALTLMLAGVAIALGWNAMSRAGDAAFLRSFIVTLYYALGTVPLQIVLSLVLATILHQKLRGQELFRMLYFLPYITPVVATAVVFRSLFSPRETGLANTVLGWLHLAPQQWLFEPRPWLQALFGWNVGGPSLALVTIILFGVWTYVGYNVVIFLAGLGDIPRDLYEAAEIDGASGVQKFTNVTIPLLSPVIFYLTLVGFIGTLQAFNHLYVMRVPSAQGTVDTVSLTIFDTFYQNNNYGLAAAQSFLLFFVILAITLMQFRFFGRKVFYG